MDLARFSDGEEGVRASDLGPSENQATLDSTILPKGRYYKSYLFSFNWTKPWESATLVLALVFVFLHRSLLLSFAARFCLRRQKSNTETSLCSVIGVQAFHANWKWNVYIQFSGVCHKFAFQLTHCVPKPTGRCKISNCFPALEFGSMTGSVTSHVI